MGDYYVSVIAGDSLFRADVMHRTSPEHHALICTCTTQADAERIAAALNAQPQAEPVAFYDFQENKLRWAMPMIVDCPISVKVPELALYTAPQPQPRGIIAIHSVTVDSSGREVARDATYAAPQPQPRQKAEPVAQRCIYPDCNCPFDHPGTKGWCARGFATDSTPQPQPQAEPGGEWVMVPRDVLQRCCDTAMDWSIRAAIPECGHFSGIAQDLDWILSGAGQQQSTHFAGLDYTGRPIYRQAEAPQPQPSPQASAEDVALVDELVRQSGLAGPTMKDAWQRIRADYVAKGVVK